ncbi:PstS family phosphate ABC transporter substrate-binding protein [Flavobacterium selenitireducens]|uniref:PstS family phosphate ABC transporter substrate-binding protein n=1 Tax=Flavobacterium selenitireducens TaxID=2722704 RepID=UPI00168AEAB8|nr:substrate-binding domain-containing protein [Flavobacterium selenitireducens]MBD3583229.1 phosphate ABC transporter substrate-binding protein [Flavobacterium selenitireducens]
MKKRWIPILVTIGVFFLAMCSQRQSDKPEDETILTGKASVLVDETLLPIVEDQVQVFESDYRGTFNLIPKSEAEAVQALLKDSAKILVMARKLSEEELKFFTSRERYPKQTQFGSDGIALIGSAQSSDTLIALKDVVEVMKGNVSPRVKGLVFDNPNSGTAAYMMKLSEQTELPSKGVYSFRTNAEVIKFVSENPGMVGVIGINWLWQPTPEIESYLKKINILSVKSLTGSSFVYPSQNNLAEKTYPLARDLYVVNTQGYEGLGIGLASFMAGERGQRIILKSGLLPIRIPSRKIVIKKN